MVDSEPREGSHVVCFPISQFFGYRCLGPRPIFREDFSPRSFPADRSTCPLAIRLWLQCTQTCPIPFIFLQQVVLQADGGEGPVPTAVATWRSVFLRCHRRRRGRRFVVDRSSPGEDVTGCVPVHEVMEERGGGAGPHVEKDGAYRQLVLATDCVFEQHGFDEVRAPNGEGHPVPEKLHPGMRQGTLLEYLLGPQLRAAVDHVDLAYDVREGQPFLHGRVPSPDHRHVAVLEEKAVAGGAVGDASPLESSSPGMPSLTAAVPVATISPRDSNVSSPAFTENRPPSFETAETSENSLTSSLNSRAWSAILSMSALPEMPPGKPDSSLSRSVCTDRAADTPSRGGGRRRRPA